MTPNLKLQEAIDYLKQWDWRKDYLDDLGGDYFHEVLSAAQSIMAGEDKWGSFSGPSHPTQDIRDKPKPSGEVTKIARTANNEIIAITYEGKQYYPKELHPAVTISDNDMTIAYAKGVEDGKDSVEAKQMTVQEIYQIIAFDFMDDFDKFERGELSRKKLSQNIATALFEAVYGSNK